MNALLVVTVVLAAQPQDLVLAPQEPEILEINPLPNDGAEDVPLDTLVWSNSFNGTSTLVGPDGPMVTEVVQSIGGPAFVEGIRPVDGFEPGTRYTILEGFTERTLGEFTTGTDATSTPPDAPTITNAEQRINGETRTLRYGVGAFDNLYILVNPDDPLGPGFANHILDGGGLFEFANVSQTGELTTTFVAMNSAGMLSEVITETHEEPPGGCAQASASTASALFALLVLARRRRRA